MDNAKTCPSDCVEDTEKSIQDTLQFVEFLEKMNVS